MAKSASCQFAPGRGVALASAVLLSLLSGCESPDAEGGEPVSELPALVAHPELRIGSVGDPAIGFSRIGGLAVGDDGIIYVAESSVPEVRAYSAEGVLQRRFGGRGDGPGEFRNLATLGVRGDTVWAFDSRHDRITTFHREGALLATSPLEKAPVPLTNGVGFVFPAVARSDGTVMGRLSRLSYAGGDPGLVSGPSDLIPVPLVRFSLAGEVIDTIGWAERPPPGLWRPEAEEPERGRSIQVGGRRHEVPRPGSTMSEYLQLADGYVMLHRPQPTSETGIVTVVRMGVSGDTIYERKLAYVAPRYASTELDSIAARAGRGMGGESQPVAGSAAPPPVENPEALSSRLRAEMDFPTFRMPIERAWAGDDGSVWIAQRDGNADSLTWVVLGPDGSARGRLRLLASVWPRWFRGDTLFASTPDELDVPWLVRYRIE